MFCIGVSRQWFAPALVEQVAEDFLRGLLFESSRVLQAGGGEVLAVVAQVLPVAVVSSAVKQGNRVCELLLEVLACDTVIGVHNIRVAEQVAHVAHVSTAGVIGVALGNRASLGRASSAAGREREGDNITVLVALGEALDLNEVGLLLQNRVVAHVVRVNPCGAIGNRSRTRGNLGHNVSAAVREIDLHLGHRVSTSHRLGASRELLEVILWPLRGARERVALA